VQNIAGWQWLFILQGVVTLVVAGFGFFLLPNYPLTTLWLSQDERQLAHNRIESDTVANEGETGLMGGLKQAVKDPLVWVSYFNSLLVTTLRC
jgi:sugar phosphate permease